MTNNDINNFQDYGFTANFEGEILKEVNGEYFGYVFDIEIIRNVAIKWSSLGVVLTAGMNRFKLTPIKQEWYENPDNFPILLIRKKVWKMFAMPNFNIRMINEQGWRLANKAELLGLYMWEDNEKV